MTRLALPPLLAFVAVLAACEAASLPPSRSDGTEPRARPFAITDACGACAEEMLAESCAAEADACQADPDCAAIANCVLGCDPADAACAEDCLASSADGAQLFGAVADCVVCDMCPAECDGAWDCGGSTGGDPVDPPADPADPDPADPDPADPDPGDPADPDPGDPGGGACDGTGDCEACAFCAAQGPCEQELEGCFLDEAACDALEECVLAECPDDCGSCP